jgi:AhpD family alkylhydroperoxidase
MGFDARERLERFNAGVGVLSEEMPQTIKSMFDFIGSASSEGALTPREKELVAIGITMVTRCEDCIAYHTHGALKAGCTRQEILEAAGMAMAFGGGPTLGASASLLLDALDEFEKDFPKAS